MKKNTEGELEFERYLLENKIQYKFEPILGIKVPDYLLELVPPVLVEVEDFGTGKLEKEIQAILQKEGSAEWSKQSYGEVYGRIRAEIKAAYQQLKEFGISYICVPIIYKRRRNVTDDTYSDNVLGAMYGDIEYIINPQTTRARRQFTTKNAILGPRRRNIISAVAVLETIQPNRQTWNKRTAHISNSDSDQLRRLLEEEHQKILLEDPSFFIEKLRLRIYHNRFATKPLPQGLFSGLYDQEIFFNEKENNFKIVGFQG